MKVNLESEGSAANNTWFSHNLHLGHLIIIMMIVMIMTMMMNPIFVTSLKILGDDDEESSFYGGQVVSYYRASNYITKPSTALRSIIKLD